jgi:hypothetical protein
LDFFLFCSSFIFEAFELAKCPNIVGIQTPKVPVL